MKSTYTLTQAHALRKQAVAKFNPQEVESVLDVHMAFLYESEASLAQEVQEKEEFTGYAFDAEEQLPKVSAIRWVLLQAIVNRPENASITGASIEVVEHYQDKFNKIYEEYAERADNHFMSA